MLELRALERRLATEPGLDRTEREALRLRVAWLAWRLGERERARRALRAVLDGEAVASDAAIAYASLLRAEMLLDTGAYGSVRSALETARAHLGSEDQRTWLARCEARLPRPDHSSPRAAPKTIAYLHRDAWHPRPIRRERLVAMGRPNRITVHHSGYRSPRGDAGSQVRAFQRNHIVDRGWGDIGYHFLIDRQGHVIEGRELRWQGAHAGNGAANRGNIGVCVLGNFEPGTGGPAERPTGAQVAALRALLAALCERFQIPPSRIYTHREIHPKGRNATRCPGRYLQPVIARVRTSLARGAQRPLSAR